MRKVINNRTALRVYNTLEGETIEMKVERIVNNNEPIEDIAPTIYQSRNDGVQAQYDVRTDRFELGIEAMDSVQASMIARRQEYHKSKESPAGESIDSTEQV